MSAVSRSGSELEPPKGEESPVMFSKTCQNCFSLKIRCDRTQRADICDRCARLNKQCVFRPARRRDNSAKRDSRIQALEQQVQDLLRTQRPDHRTQKPLPGSSPLIVSSTSSASSSAVDTLRNGDVVDENIVSVESADTMVELYKSDMMPHFPFLILPSHVNGRTLRYDRPFLFLAILSVASFHDPAVQERLGKKFQRLISEKVLLGGDDCLSLEYIQGLLVALAWNQYHNKSRYYSQYLHLAISLAVDMRLDRKPLQAKPINPNSKREPLHVVGESWGSEEQRATAGLFYLSSTISRLLDKTNTFVCTQFIEEGCYALAQKAEHKTDKDLYHVIRLQRVIEDIHSLADPSISEEQAQTAYLHKRDELESFRIYLASDSSDSHFLFMQFHIAKLFLYQVAFFERSLQHNPALHLDTLCEGLESAKTFLDLYLWLPPKSEMNLTNSEWIQINFGLTLAAKFALVSKDPNVESRTRELRRRLNIENVFRHFSLRIGAMVGRADDDTRQRDVFAYYENRIRKIQNWYERMCRATGSDNTATQQTQALPPLQRPSVVHTGPLTQPPTLTALASQFAEHRPPAQSQLVHAHYSSAPPVDNAITSVGMAPITSSHTQYTTALTSPPILAFPDLMSMPGWDMLCEVPMVDDIWMYDPGMGYQGQSIVNVASEGRTWGRPLVE